MRKNVFMIKWAKKVPQALIFRLYNQSASGIYDDDLADEAGWGLYARCESIISVTNGFERKRLICPECGAEVPLMEGGFICPCGFHAALEEFRSSYKGKQLYGANALPVFQTYYKNFPKAKTYGDKIICIDILLHSFHIKNLHRGQIAGYDLESDETAINRPAAANLIEGSLSEVILFLDKLSEISEFSQEKARWEKLIRRADGGGILANGFYFRQGV